MTGVAAITEDGSESQMRAKTNILTSFVKCDEVGGQISSRPCGGSENDLRVHAYQGFVHPRQNELLYPLYPRAGSNEGNGARHGAAVRFADTIATHLRKLRIPLR
jgi:hypothetical protein